MKPAIAPNSTSYPTLGALMAHYGEGPRPAHVVTAAYWLTDTVLKNLRARRRPTDMNHISYELLRTFDVLESSLSDRIIRNAQASYAWCIENLPKSAPEPEPPFKVGNQAGYYP